MNRISLRRSFSLRLSVGACAALLLIGCGRNGVSLSEVATVLSPSPTSIEASTDTRLPELNVANGALVVDRNGAVSIPVLDATVVQTDRVVTGHRQAGPSFTRRFACFEPSGEIVPSDVPCR